MEPLVRISSLGTSTKERCYELVNNYYGYYCWFIMFLYMAK